jgi:two-component system nitrogen regulation sensor histidine kinase GlnL
MIMVETKVCSFFVDRNLRIRSWGEGIETFTHKRRIEALGKKYFDVLPRLLVNGKDIIATSIKDGRKRSFEECPLVCFNGYSKTRIRVNPLKSANSGIERVRIDISPCVSSPAAENRENKEVTPGLNDLGKIASNLAHGVRNPLNAIKGAAVFLREKFAREKPVREFTEIIESEIARIDDFISRFLSSSILKAEPLPADINSLITKIELLTAHQAQAYKIKAIYEYGDIPPMIVDAFLLERAVLNTINSAIESVRYGGVLKVRTHLKKGSGPDSILIDVSHAGSGISEKRMNGRNIHSLKGKEFDLFVTREIIQQLGGHIEIKSAKKEGTRVRLYLPVRGSGGRSGE